VSGLVERAMDWHSKYTSIPFFLVYNEPAWFVKTRRERKVILKKLVTNV